MKKTSFIPKLIVAFLFIGILSGCFKKEIPLVTTGTATSITHQSAIIDGEVTDDGNADLTAVGIVYGPGANPVLDSANATMEANLVGVFTSDVTGLAPNITYHYRAYATNEAGTAYGDVKSFKTLIK